MKLAIIDYSQRSDFLVASLINRDIEVERSTSFFEFERTHDSLQSYDGLLLHLDINEWSNALRNIPLKYPYLRYALATNGLGEYLDNGEVRVFDFSDVESIVSHFFPFLIKENHCGLNLQD